MRFSVAKVVQFPLITSLVVALVATTVVVTESPAQAASAQTAKPIGASLSYPAGSNVVRIGIDTLGLSQGTVIELLRNGSTVESKTYETGSFYFDVNPPTEGTDIYKVRSQQSESSELRVAAGVRGFQLSYSLSKDIFGASDPTPTVAWASTTSLASNSGYYSLYMYDKASGAIIQKADSKASSQGSFTIPRFKTAGAKDFGLAVAKASTSSSYNLLQDVTAEQTFSVARKAFELTATLDKTSFSNEEQTPKITATLNQSLNSYDADWRFYLIDESSGAVINQSRGDAEGKVSFVTPTFDASETRSYKVLVAEAGVTNRSAMKDVRAESSSLYVTHKDWSVNAVISSQEFTADDPQPVISVESNQRMTVASSYRFYLVDELQRKVITNTYASSSTPTKVSFTIAQFDESEPRLYSVYIAQSGVNGGSSVDTLKNVRAMSQTVSTAHKPWAMSASISANQYDTGSADPVITATANQTVSGSNMSWYYYLVDVDKNESIYASGYSFDSKRGYKWTIPKINKGETRNFRVYIARRVDSSTVKWPLQDVRAASQVMTLTHKPWDSSYTVSKASFTGETGNVPSVSLQSNQPMAWRGTWCYMLVDETSRKIIADTREQSGTSFGMYMPVFWDTENRFYKVYLADCDSRYKASADEMFDIQWSSGLIVVERKTWSVKLTGTPGGMLFSEANYMVGNGINSYLVDETRGVVEIAGNSTNGGSEKIAHLSSTYPTHTYRSYLSTGGALAGQSSKLLKNIVAISGAVTPLDSTDVKSSSTGEASPVESCSTSCAGDPINTYTGDFYETDVDVSAPGAPSLYLSRSYSTQSRSQAGLLGPGWVTNLDQKLDYSGGNTLAQATDVSVQLSNGAKAFFVKDGNDYRTYAKTKATLKRDLSTGEFNLLDVRTRITSKFDANGRFIGNSDSNGNMLAVEYSNGKPSRVSNGASAITLRYNTQELLDSAEFAGKVISYSYEESGRLAEVHSADLTKQSYRYDSSGRVTSMTSADGVVTANEYDSNDRVVSQTEADRTLKLAYDGDKRLITAPDGTKKLESYNDKGQLVEVREAFGTDEEVSRSYTYSKDNQVSSTTFEDGKTEYLFYDRFGNVIKKVDTGGATTLASYTDSGLPLSVTLQNGATTYFTYDERGNPTKTTDPLGNETKFEYSSRGLQSKIIDANGSVTEYSYTPADLVAKVMKSNGAEESFRYNSAGDRTKIVGPTGAVISRELDADGKPLSETDANGNVTSYSYDSLQRLKKTTYADGSSESYSYNVAGEVVSSTDTAGAVTKFSYNANGDLAKKIDAAGSETTYSYNAFGEKTRETDQTGNATRFAYTKRGLLSKLTAPGGEETTYSYSATGKLLKETNANGEVKSYSYDAVGNLISFTDPNGGITRYEYNLNNQLTKQTYPDGTFESSGYDKLGRVVSYTDASGALASYSYDSVGNQIATDEAGVKLSYEYTLAGQVKKATNQADNSFRSYSYDAAGQVTEESYSDGSPVTKTYYDSMGRKTEVLRGNESTGYSYDAAGRLSAKTDANGSLSYSYDELGNLAKLTYPSGMKISYSYNALSQLTTVKRGESALAAYDYNSNGQVIQVSTPSGETDYSYDSVGRLLGKNSAAIKQSYSYDSAGNTRLANLEFKLKNGSVEKRNNTYTFDAKQRLATSSKKSYSQGIEISNLSGGFNFNATDDLLAQPDGTTYSLGEQKKLSKLVNGSTQTDVSYTARGEVEELATTEAGELTKKLSYSYDLSSRLVEANLAANPPNEISKTYSYSPEGLLSKTVVGSGADATTEKLTWDTGSDAPLLLQSKDDDSQTEFVYGLGSAPIGEVTSDGYREYITDRQGSVIGVLDTVGELVIAAEYSEYGELKTVVGDTDKLTLAYTGALRDTFTGNYYLVNRFYDPLTARFLTVDPALTATHSSYSYVSGNPLNSSDPLGLSPWSEAATFAVGALDSYTFGLAGKLVEAVAPGAIDQCSTAWKAGALVGDVASFVLPPGAGALRAGAKAITHSGKILSKFKANLKEVLYNGKHADRGSLGLEPKPDIVYRALAANEDPKLGLVARDVTMPHSLAKNTTIKGAITPLSHVAGTKKTPWISTTKNRDIAAGKYNSGNGYVAIDLEKVTSHVEDVSAGFPGKGRFDSYARSDQEVLVLHAINPEAIIAVWK